MGDGTILGAEISPEIGVGQFFGGEVIFELLHSKPSEVESNFSDFVYLRDNGFNNEG